MIRFKLLIVLLIGATVLSASKNNILKDVYKPRSMAVYKNNLYVADQNSVLVFNLENMERINRFVKRGQGPSEFYYTPLIKVTHGKLLVYHSMKYAFFKPSGQLISEKNVPYFFNHIEFVGENYVLARMDQIAIKGKLSSVQSIAVYNKEGKKIKNLATEDITFKRSGSKKIVPLIYPVFKFQQSNNNIYVAPATEKFQIDIYDKNGKDIGAIRKGYKQIEITEEFKTRKLEEHKNRPQVKKRWHISKKIFKYTFPGFFPAIKDFLIADKRIYVKTYLEKDGKEEYWVLTLDGKLLKKIFLPKSRERFCTFANNRFYFIFENEDEEWECYSVKLF